MRVATNGLALTALLAFASALPGCAAKSQQGDGVGIVRAIGADHRSVTLEHGDVPGLMKEMTMEYSVAKPELLTGIAVGQTVEFHLVHERGLYSVTELHQRAP